MAIARFDNVNVKKKKTARFDDVQQKSDGRYSAKAAGNAAAPQTSQQSSSALPTLSAEEARSRARALFAPSAAAKAGMEFATKEEKETQYMPSLVMPQSREDQLWLENRESPLSPNYDPTETKSSMLGIAQQYARGNYSSPAVDAYEQTAKSVLGDIAEKVKHPEVTAYEQERAAQNPTTADMLLQEQYMRDTLAGDSQADDAYMPQITEDMLTDTETSAKSAPKPGEQTKAQSDREAYYTAGMKTFESIPLEKRDVLYNYFWIRQVADSVPDTKSEIRYTRPDGQTVVISREQYDALKGEYESLMDELDGSYSADDLERMQNTLSAYANELNRAQSDVLTAKYATMQPIVASLGSIGGRMVGGITATADLIGQNLAKIGKEDGYKKPVDYNTWASETLNAANVGRGTVSENISYTAGDFASFIYDATMSIADTTITGALPGGKVLSSVSLVASTAFDSAKAAADRGVADWQALGVGLVSGALELAVEKIPKFGTLSRLEDLQEIPIASFGDLIRSMFASAHLNGCDEAVTEILNRVNEWIWSPSTSSATVAFNEYRGQGMEFGDALQKVVGDIALDVLKAYGGGFIGGAEMQGSLGTMNYALNIGTAKEYRDLFVGSDGKLNEATYNALMTKALSSKDETVQKYAAVLADRRDSVTANDAGMLYAMLEASEQQADFDLENSPSTSVKFDSAENYTPEKRKTIKEYLGAVNQEFVGFVQRVKNGEKTRPWFSLGKVNERTSEDVQRLTGIDVSEYEHGITPDDVRHVEKRHGENGEADHSMRDNNDVARVQYVLENYDTVDLLDDTTTAIANSDGSPAQKIKFSKKINGTYYVVEAVLDSQKKKMRIISAYISAKEASPEHSTRVEPEDITSETQLPYNADTNSIPRSAGNSQGGAQRSFATENPAAMQNSVQGEKSGAVEHDPINDVRNSLSEDGRAAFDIAMEGATDPEATARQFKIKYLEGETGAEFTVDEDGELTPSMQEAAYKYGAEAAKTVANGAKTEYNNTYTEADNGRKVHLRDGGERTDGTNTGEQVRVVEEGTGRNQSGQTKGKPRDSEAASLTLGKEVSTASFYIQNGSRTDKIYRIAGGETTAMKNARVKASERGLNVVFFAGGNLTVDGKPARGYISGKNVLIRADDPDFTADQIMEHEIGHDKIAKGEIDLDTVKDRLNSIYGAETVDFICQQYVEAYEGSNLAPEKVFEEMVCDSLGDMNAFDSESEIREAADGFLATTKAVTEASARAATNPDAFVEGKASTAWEAKSTETYFKSVFSKVSIDKIRSEVRGNIKSQYSQFRSEFLKYFDSDSVESAWVFVSTVYYGRTYAYVFPLRDADFRDITGYKVPQKYQRNIHNLTLKHLKEIRSNAISKNDESIHGPTGKSNNKISGNDYSGYDTNDNNGDFENRRNNGSIPSSSKYIGAFSGNESDQGGNGGDYVVSSDGTQDLKQLTVTLWNYFKENSPDTTTYLLMKKIAQEAGIDTEASSNEAVFSADKNTDKNGANGHSSHVLPSDRTSKPLTVEQKEIWKRVQKMTPMQIANMQLEDIDPLPKRTPKAPSGINAENGKESKFFGSAMDSDNVTEDTKRLIETVDDIRYYAGISNEETLNEANDRLNLKGLTENNRFFALTPNNATAVDVAEGFILLKRYQDKGDFETACEVARKLREIGTSAGQTVQTFSILGRLTPEGMEVYAQKELDAVREEMIRKHSEAWVEQRKDMFSLSAEEMQFIKDNMIAASKLPDGREKNILIAKIASMLEEKLPTSVLRMVNGYTRNCMLLNTKTMLRNVLGNAVMLPMYTVEDFAGALLDKSLAKKSGVRTKGATFVNGAALTAAKKGLFESYDDFRHHVNTRQMDGDRFEIGQGNDFHRYTIEERKAASPVKRAAMKLSNALNAVDRFTGFLLDAGDRPFFEAHFIQSLNNQMSLNGVSEPTESMIHIANAEALQRTWQDDNHFTKFVQNIRNGLNFGKDFGLGSIVIAFTKTPANLTKALLEYSPAGLVKAITYNAYKYSQSVKHGVADTNLQKAFVDAFGKGVAGTLATVIGMLLANFDLISGGDDDEDKDVANFKRNIMGIAPYSVTVNGISFSYDWAQPVGGIFAISADLVEGIRNNKEPIVTAKDVAKASGNAILNALAAGGNVLFEQSFLRGVSELFGQDQFVEGIITSALGGTSQFVPTALGQIAQMCDPYIRTSYAYKDRLGTAANKALAKIPGARNELAPVVDVLGHEVIAFNQPWNVMLNPSNMSKKSATEAALEIYRVYEETGDTTIIPRVAPYYFEYGGERYMFTPHERADYQRAMGSTNERIVNDLKGTYGYKKLSDEDKAKALTLVTDYATANAKYEYLAENGVKYERDSWMIKAAEGVDNGVTEAEYIVAKTVTKGIVKGLPDKNGETYDNSKSLLIMEAIYSIPNLSDEQRKYLFESFGVGSKVRGYTREGVKNTLSKMRAKTY